MKSKIFAGFIVMMLFATTSLAGGLSISFSLGSHHTSHMPPVVRYQPPCHPPVYQPCYPTPYQGHVYGRGYGYSDPTIRVRQVWVPARYETVTEPRTIYTRFGPVVEYVQVTRLVPGYWVVVTD